MKIDLFAKVVLTVLAIGIAFFVLDQDLVKNVHAAGHDTTGARLKQLATNYENLEKRIRALEQKVGVQRAGELPEKKEVDPKKGPDGKKLREQYERERRAQENQMKRYKQKQQREKQNKECKAVWDFAENRREEVMKRIVAYNSFHTLGCCKTDFAKKAHNAKKYCADRKKFMNLLRLK